MKKFLTILGVMIFLLIIDISLMPFLSINGCYPSLLLIFSIFYSLLSGRKEAIIIGLMSGFFQDIYFLGVMGINGFGNFLVCFLACEIGNTIFKEKYFMPVISCFFLSIVKGLIIIAISFFIKQKITFTSILFISIYNFVVGLFMYRLVYNLHEKPWMKNSLKY